jgi:hypothetical protein
MTPLSRIEQIEARIDAATYNDAAGAFSLHDTPTQVMNMQLAIRTAAFPLIQNAPADLAFLTASLREALEGLEFYADRNNWMRSWITYGENISPSQWADKLKVQDCAMLNCGGGRARLTLASIAGKAGG